MTEDEEARLRGRPVTLLETVGVPPVMVAVRAPWRVCCQLVLVPGCAPWYQGALAVVTPAVGRPWFWFDPVL